MSILTVKNISHGFGDRAIFEDVSFRLLKGEHVGLIEELFYGNINPQTRAFRPDRRVQRASKLLSDNEELLTNQLSGEAKKLFLEYVNAWAEANDTDRLDSVIMGFRLGAGMAFDTFVSNAAPFEDYTK